MDNVSCRELKTGVSVQVLNTFNQIEEFRSEWREFQTNEDYPILNADIDRYMSVVRAFGEKVKPYVMVFKRDGKPVSIVVARQEYYILPARIGYKMLYKPVLRTLTIEHGGIIGEKNAEICNCVVRELLDLLQKTSVELVFFQHLKTDDYLYKLIRTIPNVLQRCHFPDVQSHWMMLMADDIDAFYYSLSSNNRHRRYLRKCLQRLENRYPGEVRIVTYRRVEELNTLITAVSKISKKTYQHALGAGFEDDFKTRTLLLEAAQQGWLRGTVLYLDDEPTAFLIAMKYHKTYFLDQMGFDPQYRNLDVGTVVLMTTLERLCKKGEVETVDYYVGDADYKTRFCNKKIERGQLYIFAPGFRPVMINAYWTIVRAVNEGFEYIFNRSGLTGWAKRKWRRTISRGEKSK